MDIENTEMLYDKIRLVSALLFLLSFFPTCFAQSRHTLVDYQFIGELNTNLAAQSVKNIPALNTLVMKHDLGLYKIHYYTQSPSGKSVVASGLVAFPLNMTEPTAIVNYYHGTRINRDDVPTRSVDKYYPYLATFGSSGGYMVVMPDYLGLGDNDLPVHPYVQDTSLASSSIDMFLAAKELSNDLHIQTSEKIFLAGYSEGGFTTIVTYDAILAEHPDIHVTAVAPGSAPYDWNETMRFIILNPGPRSSAYLAYFFYSMQIYQHSWLSLSAIFQKPYDTLIPTLYDGNHTNEDVLRALPQNPRDLLQPIFLNNILTGKDPHTSDLEKNMNHYFFSADAPLLLIGTKGDADVPYHGAEIAYVVLSAKSNKVLLKSVSDTLDHLQANPVVTKEQLEFFQQFQS